MQIQGDIVRLFSIEINRKYLLLYNNTNYFTIDDEANNKSDLYLIGFWISAVKWEYEYLTCNWSLEQLFFSLSRLLKLDELLQCRLPVPDLPISSIGWSLGPQNLRGLRSRCIISLTLLLDFHTCAVILSKQPFRNFPYTVALHFRILQNFKHPSSSSPLLKLLKLHLPPVVKVGNWERPHKWNSLGSLFI